MTDPGSAAAREGERVLTAQARPPEPVVRPRGLANARLCWMRDTKHLDLFGVSSPLAGEIAARH